MNFCAQAREVPLITAQTLFPSVESANFRPYFPQTFALVLRKFHPRFAQIPLHFAQIFTLVFRKNFAPFAAKFSLIRYKNPRNIPSINAIAHTSLYVQI